MHANWIGCRAFSSRGDGGGGDDDGGDGDGDGSDGGCYGIMVVVIVMVEGDGDPHPLPSTPPFPPRHHLHLHPHHNLAISARPTGRSEFVVSVLSRMEEALTEEGRTVAGVRIVSTFLYIHVRWFIRYHYVHLLENGQIVFFGGSYNSNSRPHGNWGFLPDRPSLKMNFIRT